MSDPIEDILRRYDRADDNGKGYREYYDDVFLVYFEPNFFESEEVVCAMQDARLDGELV